MTFSHWPVDWKFLNLARHSLHQVRRTIIGTLSYIHWRRKPSIEKVDSFGS